MTDGTYTALFSGGKDSYLALGLAREAGLDVDRLLTVDADVGSHLYHAPATRATAVTAGALGLAHERARLAPTEGPAGSSAAAAARELEPLARWLDDRLAATDPPLAGLVSGVVESRYQRDRLAALCAEGGIELVTPLWGWDGRRVLGAMLDAGLAVDVVAVAAEGLDRSWLGRRLDAAAVEELLALAARHGIHPAGEGGEYETLVVDAPDRPGPIRYEADVVWSGDRGHLALTDVDLPAARGR